MERMVLDGGKFSEQVLAMETIQVVQGDVILLWIRGVKELHVMVSCLICCWDSK